MLLGWTSREDILGPHTHLVTVNGIFRPFAMVEGRAVALHPVQQAFHEHHALQCGYCTPGMVWRPCLLIERRPGTSEAAIREGLEGNLCRCTGYHNIVKAVAAAATAS